MDITVEAVKELRTLTGAGVLDCKKALVDTQGDMDEAVRLLREKGLAAAAKRAHREARDGVIASYMHHSSRVAALVELNCETDFVARTDQFKELAYDLAMQVAATNPRYLVVEDVPEEVIEEERAVYRAEFVGNKPDHVIDRIVDGKIKKFYEEICLLEQPFIRDSDIKIKELVAQVAAQVGENVVVRRFVRFEIGAE